MRTRITILALGLACIATAAAAQGTTPSPNTKTAKSDQRITISKGEVAVARVDTVYVTRYDTVTVTKLETVRVPVIEHDTVIIQQAAPLPAPLIKGPFYGGFFVGTAMPSGNIDRLYTTGLHAGGILGYEEKNAFLGARFTGTYTQLSAESGLPSSVVGTMTPVLFSASADLKVMPLTFPTWKLYAIGGITNNVYRGLATVSKAGSGVTGVDGHGGWYAPAPTDWTSKLGFSVGGGADFQLGSQELYFEARTMALNAHGARTWFVPVSIGFRYF